jgi:hypothetical protein
MREVGICTYAVLVCGLQKYEDGKRAGQEVVLLVVLAAGQAAAGATRRRRTEIKANRDGQRKI